MEPALCCCTSDGFLGNTHLWEIWHTPGGNLALRLHTIYNTFFLIYPADIYTAPGNIVPYCYGSSMASRIGVLSSPSWKQFTRSRSVPTRRKSPAAVCLSEACGMFGIILRRGSVMGLSYSYDTG